MKKELLSPVGNMESLYQAVNNGADAVYLGGKKYGARMFSDNFTLSQLVDAINYCHLYNVKIYITINTIIFNNEIEDFLNYVEFIYKNGVDAVIMQDIGMIYLVRKKFPDLEIHASTQAHNYNNEGLLLLKELGVSRVVLARELSLEEVKNIDVGLEKEIFIHGALCVCYSGCCLFSSLVNNRSGNRGECVASCRLSYELYKNNSLVKTEGNYLLSTKELNTMPNFKEIMDSDVTSLKIEGRMKSPIYVGFVTKLYRNLIDKYYLNKPLDIASEEQDLLKTLYNRKFTTGYLFKQKGKALMNIESPNHIGLEIGEVISFNNKYIKIKLNKTLHQEDGIKFLPSDKGMIVNKLYNEKLLLVNRLDKGSIAIVDNKIGLDSISKVMLTTNNTLIKELTNMDMKKIGINIKVEAKLNNRLAIAITCNDITVRVEGSLIVPSINREVTKENIKNQVSKLGNTNYKILSLDIDSDNNIFIPLKELNELRRKAIEEITKKRIAIKDRVIKDFKLSPFNKRFPSRISILVRNKEQLLTAIKLEVDYIYVTNYELYQEYKHLSNIYYRIPRVSKNYPIINNENILVTDLGSFYKYKDNNNVVTDYYLNIVNDYAVNYLAINGASRVTISPDLKNITNFNNNIPLEVIIYGRLELMITKYCPLNMLLNNDSDKCNLCLNKDKYYLKDKLGNMYPIISSPHITHIMHSKNIDLISDIDKYLKNGFSCFRIELYEEKEKEIIDIINRVRGSI